MLSGLTLPHLLVFQSRRPRARAAYLFLIPVVIPGFNLLLRSTYFLLSHRARFLLRSFLGCVFASSWGPTFCFAAPVQHRGLDLLRGRLNRLRLSFIRSSGSSPHLPSLFWAAAGPRASGLLCVGRWLPGAPLYACCSIGL
ncbi:hypothetical protein NDU88_011489 [Pleurodeles waltl]|uniref:Transmembrane protein n=1 Tax=Pleurodeles waltl TaxID=8319 RepID=A0AAV7S4E6_PLEWA|nr:hypothetical protein NDU88_011489 [Pleurodeles waltl]